VVLLYEHRLKIVYIKTQDVNARVVALVPCAIFVLGGW
jgi:hypothetical protein